MEKWKSLDNIKISCYMQGTGHTEAITLLNDREWENGKLIFSNTTCFMRSHKWHNTDFMAFYSYRILEWRNVSYIPWKHEYLQGLSNSEHVFTFIWRLLLYQLVELLHILTMGIISYLSIMLEKLPGVSSSVWLQQFALRTRNTLMTWICYYHDYRICKYTSSAWYVERQNNTNS